VDPQRWQRLESLFEAKERGVASIQDWAAGRADRTEVA